MQNFWQSDYAVNKRKENKHAIVYTFVDGAKAVTMADYLAANPGKTEADFLYFKLRSDSNFHRQANNDNAQAAHAAPIDAIGGMDEARVNGLRHAPSPEDLMIARIDAEEAADARRVKLNMAYAILDKLTEIQRRRYLLHFVDGMTTRKIAEQEGVNQSKIMKSLGGARAKINKFLAEDKKGGSKRP